MDYTVLLAYFGAVVAWTVAPGPAMAVVVARSLGGDTRGAAVFGAGLCLGWVLLAGAVALGVGGLAQSAPRWFAAAKYAGIVYLLWLALRMWNDDTAAAARQSSRKAGRLASIGAGLAVALGNPGTVLVYLLMVPTVAPAGLAAPVPLALALLLTLAAGASVVAGAILLSGRLHACITSPASCARLNRASATAIALTSVWMLAT